MGPGYRRGGPWFIRGQLQLTTEGLHTRKLFEAVAVVSYTIDTGKSRGTTFKIDNGGYVFSCLFDSGAKISCMNMETIAALGLTSQITPSSVSVNTVNGDHMGVAGDVRVHFKIGKKCSFTHSFVVCERLSHPFIIGEDFMRKHYISLQWVPENKRALGFQGETIAVASQAILDEPLRLRNAI